MYSFYRGSGGVETANVPRVRDYDSTDSCSPPQTNMAPGTDTDSTKSKVTCMQIL